MKQKLKEIGLTQSDLARHLGISRQAVGRVVNGKATSRVVADKIEELYKNFKRVEEKR